MTTSQQLLATLLVLVHAACGGKQAPAPAAPAPAEPPAAAAKPAAETKPAGEPAPKLTLGEIKIAMTGTNKRESMEAEITLVADGTMTAKMTSSAAGKKKDSKTKTGKVTATGHMVDDAGDTVAKIADDGTVEARLVMETMSDGKVVNKESSYMNVGTIDKDGVFTAKKDGKKLQFDDKGHLTGLPSQDITFAVTAAPELRKTAMFIIVAILTSTKMSSSAASEPAKK